MMNDNKKFLDSLETASDYELAEMFRTIPDHSGMGGIPNKTRREMIKGELDYRYSKKIVSLTKSLKYLTIFLCLLTIALFVFTVLLYYKS